MNNLILLKSKIHNAVVTSTKLDYEGSIEIDRELIQRAGLCVYEKVHVLNISTGSRLETYVIEGQAGSREISLNGAAARLAQKGDRLIILAYVVITEAEARNWRPTIVKLDEDNCPI